MGHLDTNFRITWITSLSYSYEAGHRQICTMKQLKDSSYIVVGDAAIYLASGNIGFAAKFSRTGDIVWSHQYYSDIDHYAYLRDVVQNPDGSFVFVGQTMNDSLPAWHTLQDVWVVGVDSNGCEIAGCGTTGVPVVAAAPAEFAVFPNPTYGRVTIKSGEAGTLVLYNMQGQQVAIYTAHQGETDIQLPSGLGAGVYLCRFTTATNKAPVVLRLLYEP